MPLRCLVHPQPGKGSLVQWSWTNNTVDIQSEERRPSGLFTRGTPEEKQPGRIIWECLHTFVRTVCAIPLSFSCCHSWSPFWGEPPRGARLGCRCAPPQPHRDLEEDTRLLLQWPHDGARAPGSRGIPPDRDGVGASLQLPVIPLMAFFGLIDIEGSLLPGQFPWRDNKRSFSSEQNFNGTFW